MDERRFSSNFQISTQCLSFVFLLWVMQFFMILVFSIPLDSSSETHKNVKCFKKKRRIYRTRARKLSLDRWHELWETTVCLSLFPFWLSFLSQEGEMKHQKESGYHHPHQPLSLSPALHLSSGWYPICVWVVSPELFPMLATLHTFLGHCRVCSSQPSDFSLHCSGRRTLCLKAQDVKQMRTAAVSETGPQGARGSALWHLWRLRRPLLHSSSDC